MKEEGVDAVIARPTEAGRTTTAPRDVRRILGCLAGGVAGGAVAWSFAAMLGAALHCSWLGTVVGLATAALSAGALSAVDAP
jgi:hypothetical protein